MRKALVMAGALLSLTATPASSTGIDLAWNHCIGQAGAQTMRTSTCAVNTGSQTMIASFSPPAGINALEGIEVYIDYQVMGGVLPCWWNFSSGQIRSDQLTPLPVSPTDVNGNPLVLCDNHYFLDHGAIGGGWMTVLGADNGRLRGIATLPAGTGLSVLADAQQYGFGFQIANGGTVPVGSCQGCSQAVCFELRAVRLYSPGLADVTLVYPSWANYITWQASAQATSCPGTEWQPMPVLQRTWGGIKSLYR